ncbi:hypothetical protein AGIG_G25346 [Arapaima gigas]
MRTCGASDAGPRKHAGSRSRPRRAEDHAQAPRRAARQSGKLQRTSTTQGNIEAGLVLNENAATERKLARPAEPDRASEERLLCNFLNQLSAGKSEAAPRRSAAEALRSWPSAREVGFPVDVRGRRSERTFRR